jgi:hypothetical protein
MKKHLLATTALMAVGALAATGAYGQAKKPSLSLGGWSEGIVGIADQDDGEGSVSNRVGVDVQHDSEIHFKGTAALDNGLKIETRVELEGATSNGDQIDEAYVTVTGSFGQLRIGSEDNAAHLEVTPYMGSWATNVGQNLNFDTTDWIAIPTAFASGNISVNRLDVGDADSEKITYFTPRIAGVRLGLSYLPSFEEDANNSIARTSSGSHEGVAASASFDHKFGNVGIGLAAGYLQASPTAGTDQSDPKGYVVGGRVDFAGFRVSAGYHREMNMSAETAANNTGNDSIDLGARYIWGKNAVSITYAHVEADGTRANPEDDTLDHGMVSYRRDLGPGVQYRLNLMYVKFDGEAAGSIDDNEGVAATTSVRVAF